MGKEEVKLSLFADNMVSARYKINIQKSVAILYADNEQPERQIF